MTEPDDRERGGTAKTRKAVAIHNDVPGGDLPRVVATGKGAVAEQILQVAFANGIKVREDADIAELLSAVDVDSPIPIEALAAVAEILVYVYRANNMLGPGPEPHGPQGTMP